MILGFTGTRGGMTLAQRKQVRAFLLLAERIHHGDCVGADAQAHGMTYDLPHSPFVEIHPGAPLGHAMRAGCMGTVVHPIKDFNARNRDIVDACDLLVAAPASMTNQKGGTWNTIRYARKVGRMTAIIAPDGSIQRENG